MPGNCYSCATSFGIFKKELGCKNCGFAFCKECLTKKAPIPKLKNEKHKVCNKCFDIVTGKAKPEDATAKYSPPAAYVKRMAALEERQHQPPAPTTGHAAQSKPKTNASKYRGMSKEDIAIAERLEALKESRKQDQPPVPSQKEMEERLGKLKEDQPPVPSQKEMEERLTKLKEDGQPPPPSSDEMAERLAKLKGVDPGTVNKPHVFTTDKRSEQQQIDDLLDEIADEVNVDNYSYGASAASAAAGSSELENNLNKEGNEPQKAYNKNINPVGPGPQQGASEGGTDESNADLAEVQRLMESVAKEMELDAQRALQDMQKDKELMERLQKLKHKDKNENQNEQQMDTTEDTAAARADSSDEENDEELIKRIIKQHLEEVKLEDELNEAEISGTQDKKKVTNVDTSKEYESDDFPWCCICNGDAALRCFECDGDLYCKRCFREGHDKLDLKEHRTAPFKPPS